MQPETLGNECLLETVEAYKQKLICCQLSVSP